MDKLHFIIQEIQDKNILILGFGREGQATYHLLQKLLPQTIISIADGNKDLPLQCSTLEGYDKIRWYCGPDYMDSVKEADLIVKSPGIPLKNIPKEHQHKVTSQTEWFIRAYKQQICGITGTKGKSTTSSLLYHLLKQGNKKAVLVGNIGIPPFSMLDQIDDDTLIVFELSCHQLQEIRVSPSSSILLNIFQEHLDHYNNLEEYHLTKINIALHQEKQDILIYHADDLLINDFIDRFKIKSHTISYSLKQDKSTDIYCKGNILFFNYHGKEVKLLEDIYNIPLLGDHNLLNVMASAAMAFIKGVSAEDINKGVHNFQSLEHRLEKVGIYHEIIFYNDSISTIPESTIQALETLQEVHTLILGGIDRGIGYTILTDYLIKSDIKLLIITGSAGRRIKEELDNSAKYNFKVIEAKNYDEVVAMAINKTAPGKICLLSPAAASYDWFKNFEERGKTYKSLIKNF